MANAGQSPGMPPLLTAGDILNSPVTNAQTFWERFTVGPGRRWQRPRLTAHLVPGVDGGAYFYVS
jgi:hypothetical protein